MNRAPLILARIRTDIALADFEAGVRNMLLDLENSYWDLQFAYRLLETAKIGRDSALGTWRQQYELTEGGKATSRKKRNHASSTSSSGRRWRRRSGIC